MAEGESSKPQPPRSPPNVALVTPTNPLGRVSYRSRAFLTMGGIAGKDLEAELIAYCRQQLSPIKCPRSVDFDPELPRTPTGKLVKRHLRDRYWPATQKQTA